MVVTGVVRLNTDGSVHDFQLDHPEKLPEPVKNLVSQSAAAWKFQFAVAPTSLTTERMYLRVVATMTDNDHASLRVAGADFDEAVNDDSETVQPPRYPHILYPKQALEEHASGTVYLLMRIGKDGKIQNIATEQVNLSNFAPTADMARYRKYLADTAMKSAQQWVFTVPTKGKRAARSEWLVRVPVSFLTTGESVPDYGSWALYVPGPRENIPWLQRPKLALEAPDAVPNGALQSLDDDAQLSSTSGGG
ncbi:hypothetical protein [Dyella halodurans]|uniref:Energy transducer TonB n=1 Tax=Dyella halodurans TaxID=1920171 RepID=A0ABV9BWV7_9GAMM|nr:hypothetical protein [Dyella halodurans]